ncbi:MAG: SDR family NAD(P)-dependent oxidoreductase [Candidatus Poribacteria bacterium]|nr:SDR family NAD(P)-dependent oxidoreductase [Candidatus Poribacteria bacterium]
MELNGRVALVTGAARGIGKATALALAEAGADVVLLDVDAATAEATAAEIQERTERQTLAVRADVTVKTQVEAGIADTLHTFGRIDVLVNNAGVWRYGLLSDVSEDEWDRVFAVNLKGVLFGTQAVAPTMKQQRAGKIVNIASAAGLGPSPEWSAYCISKAAVITLTQVAAEEFAPFHVQVNVICPGAVDTDLTKGIIEQTGAQFPHAIPPERVAAAVLKCVCPFEQTTTGAIVSGISI